MHKRLIELFEVNGYLPLNTKIGKRKPWRKCALPICPKFTEHNGGYCCAEHCREHRRVRNKNLLAPPTHKQRRKQ